MDRWEFFWFVGTFASIFLCMFLPIIAGRQWRAMQDRERARRLADARMNARLLRLDI